MTLLPVAARELGVAARRPGTYRLRAGAALVALIMFAVVSRGPTQPAIVGQHVIQALAVAVLGFCMLAGLFLTADSIAAERQGGTLGLLFLTDLKGYDIIVGKLAAHSIQAFFALLAVFPVLALPLLMGGVTGSEFSRLVLVFGVTLLFSLSLGLAASAATDDPRRALGWALLFMALLAGVLPALWWIQSVTLNARWLNFLLWPSPGFACQASFDSAYRPRGGAGSYWHSIQTLLLAAAGCLLWACYLVPRGLEAGPMDAAPRRRWFHLRRPRPGVKPRGWDRAEGSNPFCRVTIRDWVPSSSARLLLVVTVPIWAVSWGLVPFLPRRPTPHSYIVCLFMAFGLHAIVKVLVAVESVSRLNHDRNSGALELLLVTPLSVDAILQAQRDALRQHFKGPLLVLLLLNLALEAALFLFWTPLEMDTEAACTFTGIFAGGLLALLVDFWALGWVGMWCGLKMRQAHKAVMAALARILGLPWLAVFFLVFYVEAGRGSESFVNCSIAVWFVAGCVIDLLLVARARRQLHQHFRDVAAARYDKPA